jgi:transcriptional regulator with XRE-family HTH domain
MTEKELRAAIAENLVFYRNLAGMTQLQVAEALNYSDKSVSKWERGEGLPDIYVLCRMAELYRITVSDLLNTSKKKRTPFERRSKLLVSLLSVGIVWLTAVVAFVILSLITTLDKLWLCFIYAVPVSGIVMLVFSLIWGKRVWSGIATSFIIWGISCSIYLTFTAIAANNKIWLIFLISAVLQVLDILWFFFRDVLYKMKNAIIHPHQDSK